tara:strand:- start:46 stop:1092 length:1047 start_codon:yes stop_codon:yes gene_type:complete
MRIFYKTTIVFMFSLINGQTNVGTTSASFLEIGAGARSLAMGGAYVSLANDVSALYWNPAGIASVSRPSIQLYHAPWLVETDYYHGGSVVPMGGAGALGFSYTVITMKEMLVRTVRNPEPDEYGEKFDAGSLAMGIAYAKNLTDQFSFGFQTKFIQEKIWQMQAKGFAVDIGTLFTTDMGLRIGMSVSNFGGKLGMDGINSAVDYDVDETIYGNNDRIDAHLDAAKWPLPLMFRFGISKDFNLPAKQKIILSADGIHPNNNVERINAGLEYGFSDVLFLRAGRSFLLFGKENLTENEIKTSREQQEELTFGVGINYKIPRGPKLRIDYALIPVGVFDSVTGFSIDISF